VPPVALQVKVEETLAQLAPAGGLSKFTAGCDISSGLIKNIEKNAKQIAKLNFK
jgi:hypothetical protein